MKKWIAFLFAALLGIGVGLGFAMTLSITDVTDNSMLPSYTEGDKVLVSRRAYRNEEPKAGDVVLFQNDIYSPTGESSLMLKRVIAVSGDRIMITDGKVYVNNKCLSEASYVFTEGISGELTERRVPVGNVFVLGDNRAASTDSRNETVGFVETKEILGKVIFQW